MFFNSKKFIYQILLGYFLFFLNWGFIYYRHPFYIFPLQSFNLVNILYILNFLLGCAFLPFIFFIISNFNCYKYKESFTLLFHYLYLDYALAYFFEVYTGLSTFFLQYPYYLKRSFIYSFSIAWGLTLCIILFNYLKKIFFENNRELLDSDLIEKKKYEGEF